MAYKVLLQGAFYDAEKGSGNRYHDITDVYFLGSREILLPFPPFPGLALNGVLTWTSDEEGEDEEENVPTMETVTWDQIDQRFEVWLQHEYGGDLEGGVEAMERAYPSWSFELIDENETGEE
jgi:hypothetical protein